ncbi:MAG: polysaccharide biosynthesis tyrosine autokinase [Actinomycetota bacterium]|nr:polysaccharide biosynthesis tyrosine autokinase [Actinomycetota bacterium]
MSDSNDTDLVEYIKIIAKRKGIVLATILIALTAAYIFTLRTTPVYEASIKLLVSQRQIVEPNQPATDPYLVMLMNEKLTKTFSEILQGRVAAEEVIEELDLSVEPIDLLNKLSAEPIGDTQIIKLTVKDKDAKQAARIANAMGDNFTESVKELALSERTSVIVDVVEPAVASNEPVRPKPALNAIAGLLFGLTTGIGLVFLLERLDTSVRTAEETERLTGLVSLGVIPAAKTKEALFSNSKNVFLAESFRSLSINVRNFNHDKSAQTIVVTCPSLQEGKTTISVNLAIALAQAGQKILVVDCDLRRPGVHELLGLANDVGLANLLAGQTAADNTLQQTSIEGLTVIASGPVPLNPAELLTSERMKEILKETKSAYDFVILDSPPALAVTDAVMLASQADGVLLVASFGKTDKKSFLAAKVALEKAGARILGFVINGADLRASESLNYEQSGSAYDSKATTRSFYARPLFIATIIILVIIFVFVFIVSR